MAPCRMSILFFTFVFDFQKHASAFHCEKEVSLSLPYICLNLPFKFIYIVKLFFRSQIMIKLQYDLLSVCFFLLLIAEEMNRKNGIFPA